MSRYEQPYQSPMELEERPTNPTALVGFILSFCVSPVGLILSLVSLMWRPRGFAIAGVIIGLIGTAIWTAVGVFAVNIGKTVATYTELNHAVIAVQKDLEAKKSADSKYPSDLAGITAGTDPWGTALRYEPSADGAGYTLVSAGRDKSFDTMDDMIFDHYMNEDFLTATVAVAASTEWFASLGGGKGGEYIRGMRDVMRLANDIGSYRDAHGKVPESLMDIPGMTEKLMTDPWGKPYRYDPSESGTTARITSDGPDGIEGSQDDLDSQNMRFETPKQQRARTQKAVEEHKAKEAEEAKPEADEAKPAEEKKE
ncbi:MAG TPA: type II secretion system protein GspG [Phycisphaerales bacterium]|nr:type II secretion system protein GspG [Phycisphaerales bacterium]